MTPAARSVPGARDNTHCHSREIRMEDTKTCIGDHEGHLCIQGTTMFTYDRLNDVKPLVRNPEFICGNCGRVANCDVNLCNPAPLK